jgi:hypothetical protein
MRTKARMRLSQLMNDMETLDLWKNAGAAA